LRRRADPPLRGGGRRDSGRPAHDPPATHRRSPRASTHLTRYLDLVTSKWRDAVPTRQAWITAPVLSLAGLIVGLLATGWFFLTRPSGQIVDRKSTRLNSSHVSISYAV